MVRRGAAQQCRPARLVGLHARRSRAAEGRHAGVADGLERHSIGRGVRAVAAHLDAREPLVHEHAVARAQLAVAVIGMREQHHAAFTLRVGHHIFERRTTEGNQLTPLFAGKVGVDLRQHQDGIATAGRQLNAHKHAEVSERAAGDATRHFGRGFAVREQNGVEAGGASSAHNVVDGSATRGTRVGMKINQHGKTPKKAGGGYHATQVMSTIAPPRGPHRKPPRSRARFASGAHSP